MTPSAAVQNTEIQMPGTQWGAALTVLVLDDSAAQRKMVCALLRKWGHTAIASGDPHEALDLARDPKVDLILCDWMMPGMTGPEFCRHLRADMGQKYAYVLLLTSKSHGSAVAEGLEAGADDFLTKPVRPPELRARLNAGARIVAMQRALVENNQLLETALDELQTVYSAIDRDLDEARRQQESLLQDRSYTFDEADISMMLKASGHVGGDMVGCFRVNESLIGFFSLDVSGHGVASAMIATRIAGMLSDASPDQNIAMSRRDDRIYTDLPPKMAAARLNALMLKEMQTDRYFTLCLGFLSLNTGMVRMVQAGHPHPILMRADGSVELIGDGGMPVGLIPGATFSTFECRLAPGDRLLLYSDGLTECPDQCGDFLDEDGLIDLALAHSDKAGSSFLDAVQTDLASFAGTEDFPDDVSALSIDYKGQQQPGELDKPQMAGHKKPVTCYGQTVDSDIPRKKDCAVARLGWLRPARPKARRVDVAQFLRVALVIRHVGVSVKHPQTPDAMDAIAGFFHHFAVQSGKTVLPGINSTAGQLQLRHVTVLQRRKDPITGINDGINPRPRWDRHGPGSGAESKRRFMGAPC